MPVRAVVAVAGVVAGWAVAARADDADVKKVAKAKAEELQTAFVKGDHDKLIGLMPPRVIQAAGGKKKLAAIVAAEAKATQAQKATYKLIEVSDPSDPIRAGNELYLLVPFKLEVTIPGQRVRVDSALLGVSEDGGKSWGFVDVAPGRDKLLKVLPGIPEGLRIPKPKTVLVDD